MSGPSDDIDTLPLHQAMTALDAGSRDEAVAVADAAIKVARELHGPTSAAYARAEFDKAHVLSAAGDVAGAITAMRKAIAVAIDPTDGEAQRQRLTYRTNLGEALAHTGQLDEAERILTETVLERRNLYGPDHPGYAIGLEPLTRLLLMRGRHLDALASAEEVLALFWRHGHRRVTEALAMFAFATKAAQGLEAPALERLYALPEQLVSEVVIACLEHARKLDPTVSLAVLIELQVRADAAGDTDEPWFVHVVGAVARAARAAKAHPARDEALTWLVTHFDAVDDQRQALDAVLARAVAFTEAGDAAQAEAMLTEALARAERIGDPLARSLVLRNHGVWLGEQGRLPDARAQLTEAVHQAERADPDDPHRESTLARALEALALHAVPGARA